MRHLLAKRIVSGISAFALATTTSLTAFSGLAAAAASTCTWTGTAGDNKFSTATNWSGCNSTAPQTGDIVSFGFINTTPISLVNDLPAGTTFGGVIVNTKGTQAGDYADYTIDKLALGDGAVVTNTGGGIKVGDVTQTGALTVIGYLPFWPTTKNITLTPTAYSVSKAPVVCMGAAGGVDYVFKIKPTGVTTVGDSAVYDVVGTESALVVQSGGAISFYNLPTYAGNITFNGGGTTQGSICGQAYSLNASSDTTLSGTITLTAGDIVYNLYDTSKLTITGTINGAGNALKAFGASTGTFINNAQTNNSATPAGTQVVALQQLPAITDSKPTEYLEVASNQQVSLDGVRGSVSVSAKSILNGTGTMDTLSVQKDGTVAPGHSPGKLTVVKMLYLYNGSIYQSELKTSAAGEYDQIAVGAATDATGNSVNLGDEAGAPILDLKLYEGYSIKAGDTFTIIDNLSKTAVKGTFKDLPEGATFKGPDGSVFKISYVGGDGNDVVLTVVTAPTATDTGFAAITANPVITLATAVLAAGAILFASKRLNGARK